MSLIVIILLTNQMLIDELVVGKYGAREYFLHDSWLVVSTRRL